MTEEYEFTIGSHTEQAHEYTSALIDEAYARKSESHPTTAGERIENVDNLCESHYAQIGRFPDDTVLNRLAWYVVFDEMTDRNEHKVKHAEYPILSDYQTKYRHDKETTLSDVYTGKNDETIGRYTDHDGIKRRIYDYMTPERDMSLVPTKYLDLYSALDSAGLTDRQRQAVDLVYFEGLTQEGAAEVMGVRQPNVKAYVDAGIGKIREYMGGI